MKDKVGTDLKGVQPFPVFEGIILGREIGSFLGESKDVNQVSEEEECDAEQTGFVHGDHSILTWS